MRLGLDIGTNSIGWWLFRTDTHGNVTQHLTGGVRLFGDASKNSLASINS